jgi:reverse gyrase
LQKSRSSGSGLSADLSAISRYIEYLTAEYINDMRDLNMKNLDSRTKALRELDEIIVPILKELEEASDEDLPPFMRDARIKNITKLWGDFTAKIMEEEIRVRT